MQASSVCCCLPPLPRRSFAASSDQKFGLGRWKRLRTTIFAVGTGPYDRNYGRRQVDESMIVLRKRIHEMKMVERNYEPPADWMDWEKRYYTYYDQDVCKVVGALQALLMNTRPSLAIGLMTLITLSVPTSLYMVMSHLIEMANGILPGP